MTSSTHEHNEPEWVGEVLKFWFYDLDESDWFSGAAEVDKRIRERFSALHEELAGNQGEGASTARSLLAGVIVLDQFSRHLFRKNPRAFATDAIARKLARQAVSRDLDRQLSSEQRYFLYLPFEHSEEVVDQALSVKLIEQLGSEEWTKYAIAHKHLIDRFGRFPHRNAVLGRESSAEEIEAMNQPMGSF